MLARTQNPSQQVLTKPLNCRREHKMDLNSGWQNPSHDTEDTKLSLNLLTKPSSCQRGHKDHLYMCWRISSNASETTKCISTCIDQTHLMPSRTQNASQYVLTKLSKCKQGHKIHFNVHWPSSSNANEVNKCISSCVDQIPSMLARTQFAYQHVLTISFPFQ